MTVYVLLIEDRHSDPTVRVFATEKLAKAHLASERALFENHYRTRMTNGLTSFGGGNDIVRLVIEDGGSITLSKLEVEE